MIKTDQRKVMFLRKSMQMAKVHSNTLKEVNIMDSGKMGKNADGEQKLFLVEKNILEIGETVKEMVKGQKLSLMVKNMLEIGKMEKDWVKEYIPGLADLNTWENLRCGI